MAELSDWLGMERNDACAESPGHCSETVWWRSAAVGAAGL